MTLRSIAVIVIAVAFASCTSGPAPAPGPSVTDGPQASGSGNWPAFDPSGVHEAVVGALGMTCQALGARINCQVVRPSGARFEAAGPDGTVASDHELAFTASGPIELESEARRLFSAVADAIGGDAALSRDWQDQVWAAFADPQASPGALPNGVGWRAKRQTVADVLVWSLSLTW